MTLIQKAQLIAVMVSKGHSPINAYNEANGIRAEELYREYCIKKIVLHDLFIGNFPVTQKFGMNPAMYKKFGWKGHNGIDFGTKTGTQLISPVNGIVAKAFDDKTGWGKHVYIWDRSQKILIIKAHLSRIDVKVGQSVKIGQGIGLSGNTGNSTGPHEHFGVYQVDDSGYKINMGNGYGGAINPFDSNLVSWVISNPKKAI